MWAMERGKHVYVQKPLDAHHLGSARAHARRRPNTRSPRRWATRATRTRARAVRGDDLVGRHRQRHRSACLDQPPYLAAGHARRSARSARPGDARLGPLARHREERPYSPAYPPFNWRGFFDFGCGALGDMACHILGAPNMALRLGAPTSVECTKQEGKSYFTYPEEARSSGSISRPAEPCRRLRSSGTTAHGTRRTGPRGYRPGRTARRSSAACRGCRHPKRRSAGPPAESTPRDQCRRCEQDAGR